MDNQNTITPALAGECGWLPKAIQLDRALSIVADMETDISDLRRVGSLLRYISQGSGQIESDCLGPLADVLLDLQSSLQTRFQSAFNNLGGEA